MMRSFFSRFMPTNRNEIRAQIHSSRRAISDTHREVDTLLAGVEHLFDDMTDRKDHRDYHVLSHDDVMSYFVENKPPSLSTIKGFLHIRYNDEHPHHLMQCFLDNHDDIIRNEDGRAFGRILSFHTLDDDLIQLFGNECSVIVS